MDLQSAKERAKKLSLHNMRDYIVVQADLGLYCQGYAVIASTADYRQNIAALAYYHDGQEITEGGKK